MDMELLHGYGQKNQMMYAQSCGTKTVINVDTNTVVASFIIGEEIVIIYSSGTTHTVKIYDLTLTYKRSFLLPAYTLGVSIIKAIKDDDTKVIYVCMRDATNKLLKVYCYDLLGNVIWSKDKSYTDYCVGIAIYGSTLGIATKQGVDFYYKDTGIFISTINLTITDNNEDCYFAFNNDYLIVSSLSRRIYFNQISGTPTRIGQYDESTNSGYTQYAGVVIKNNVLYAICRDGYNNHTYINTFNLPSLSYTKRSDISSTCSSFNFGSWIYFSKGYIICISGSSINMLYADGNPYIAKSWAQGLYTNYTANNTPVAFDINDKYILYVSPDTIYKITLTPIINVKIK